jgi:hypothetical protein
MTMKTSYEWSDEEILKFVALHGYIYAVPSFVTEERLEALVRARKLRKAVPQRGWIRYIAADWTSKEAQ